MLQMATDKVCWIVVKARAFDATEGIVEEDYGGNPIDEGFREVLADQPDDPTRQELVDFIEALNEDEQAELVALTWLGRGDYAAGEWPEALGAARERHTGSTAAYLLGIPILADYLEEGLAQFDLSCGDFEADHP
ncbi:MAG: DUF3775 domain-containing protein [Alphaproteobacteria bacterium]